MRPVLASALRWAAAVAVTVARRLDPPTISEREYRTLVLGEWFDETPRARAARIAAATRKVN